MARSCGDRGRCWANRIMEPSTRTPEGEPNRCPVCGKPLQIEPSRPPGDAPCPHCGYLLWFDPSVPEDYPGRISANVENPSSLQAAAVEHSATRWLDLRDAGRVAGVLHERRRLRRQPRPRSSVPRYELKAMEPTERIVTSLPLTALWTDAGFIEAKRLRYLAAAELRELLRAGPVRFAVADCGERLRWIDRHNCFEFWKNEVKAHIAAPEQLDLAAFHGEYCYVASEWSTEPQDRVILLEKHH